MGQGVLIGVAVIPSACLFHCWEFQQDDVGGAAAAYINGGANEASALAVASHYGSGTLQYLAFQTQAKSDQERASGQLTTSIYTGTDAAILLGGAEQDLIQGPVWNDKAVIAATTGKSLFLSTDLPLGNLGVAPGVYEQTALGNNYAPLWDQEYRVKLAENFFEYMRDTFYLKNGAYNPSGVETLKNEIQRNHEIRWYWPDSLRHPPYV